MKVGEDPLTHTDLLSGMEWKNYHLHNGMRLALSNQAQLRPVQVLACAAGTIQQNHFHSRCITIAKSLTVRFYTLQRDREGFLNDSGINVQVGPHMISLSMAQQQLHQFDPSGIGQHLGRQRPAA